jgi:formylglycine-generating enzyme required for sulfatase activity
LRLSTDNGATWSAPLVKVSGDVGAGIQPGQRSILWDVLAEREKLVGNAKFKVSASSRKTYEHEMVFVEGGTFQMGSNSGEEDERPVHQVTLFSFNIGKYEVTQAQWREVMGTNPSYFKDCDQCPVEQVSWNDVQDFIQKLNTKTGKQYRLPTEAEWEFAARGGVKTKGYTYSGSNTVTDVAWMREIAGSRTHPVGEKQANELGIYDMTGNVWEWCADWYGAYSTADANNPRGPYSGEFHVLRGGSLNDFARDCRSAYRSRRDTEYRYLNRGFRLVLSSASPGQ